MGSGAYKDFSEKSAKTSCTGGSDHVVVCRADTRCCKRVRMILCEVFPRVILGLIRYTRNLRGTVFFVPSTIVVQESTCLRFCLYLRAHVAKLYFKFVFVMNLTKK